MIAVGLFSILVAIAFGGFINALRTQRAVVAMLSAQSNAGLVLEQMAREMRTGYLFCHDSGSDVPSLACTPHCTVSAGNAWQCTGFIDFYDAATEEVQYRLTNGTLERAAGGGQFQPLTSDNVNVQYLSFNLQGQLEGDQWNPRVTIAMEVSPSSTFLTAGYNNILNLETTVSARGIDCTPGPAASC